MNGVPSRYDTFVGIAHLGSHDAEETMAVYQYLLWAVGRSALMWAKSNGSFDTTRVHCFIIQVTW